MRETLKMSMLCLMAVAAPALATPGESKNLGEKDWSAVSGMTALGGKIYVASAIHLWEVDPKGNAKAVPANGSDRWGRTTACTPLAGKLYCVNEEILFEVSPSGQLKELGPQWYSVPAMAALDGKLFIISDEKLYETEPATGKYTKVSEDWFNVRGMVTLGGKLYVICRDHLYEAERAGARKELGEAFNSPNGMAVVDGKIYVFAFERTDGGKLVNEATLWRVDEKTGAREKVMLPKGFDPSSGVTGMVGLDGKLFMTGTAMTSRSIFYSLDVR